MAQDKSTTRDTAKDGIIDFTAGSLGGIALVYVGQPLDTIKVKMQTFPALFPNMGYCFKQTLCAEGVTRGLYAGTLPALVANVTENSVLFMCYGLCQKLMQRVTNAESVEQLGTLSNASAGFLASFFSSIAITPTELIKCKLQAMHEKNKADCAAGKKINYVGPMKLTSLIVKEDGFVGLFRGIGPTLVREMPGYFCFFGGYEGMRELLTKPGQSKDDIGLLYTSISGAVGGMVFWTLTYPIDVVKSRIQVYNDKSNLINLMMRICRNEGVSALYNGLWPTLIRTIPATATLFVVYEYSKRYMHYVFKDF